MVIFQLLFHDKDGSISFLEDFQNFNKPEFTPAGLYHNTKYVV